MMPHNTQPPSDKKTKKNVFDFVLWSMELPMSEDSEVTQYYNRFMDLAEPLLNSCSLEDKECDALFWCGFHLDDRALLLYCLDNYPHLPTGEHLPLRIIFDVARDTFSQRPAQIKRDRHEALQWHAQFRRPHDDRHKRSPSLSQSQAQDLVEDLKAEVTYRRKQAREKERREKEKWMQAMQSLPVYEGAYASLYKRCAHCFPEIAERFPKPTYVPQTKPPATSSTRSIQSLARSSSPASPTSAHVVMPRPQPSPPPPSLSTTPALIPSPPRQPSSPQSSAAPSPPPALPVPDHIVVQRRRPSPSPPTSPASNYIAPPLPRFLDSPPVSTSLPHSAPLSSSPPDHNVHATSASDDTPLPLPVLTRIASLSVSSSSRLSFEADSLSPLSPVSTLADTLLLSPSPPDMPSTASIVPSPNKSSLVPSPPLESAALVPLTPTCPSPVFSPLSAESSSCSPPAPAVSAPVEKRIPLSMRLKSLLPSLPVFDKPPMPSPLHPVSPPLPIFLLHKVSPPTPSLPPVLPPLSASPSHKDTPPIPVSLHPVSPPLPASLYHELTPPPHSSPAAALPNPSEATEAKSESHREQEHANASKIDHSNAVLMMKLQQVQVQDSDQGTATHEDSDSTSDDDAATTSDLTSSGMLGRSVWDCNDDTCCSSPLSVCATHDFNNRNRNLAFDPGGSPLSHSSIESERNAISNTDASSLSSKLTYEHGGFSGNSNGNWFVHGTGSTHSSICDRSRVYDPGGSKFSNDNASNGLRRNDNDANADTIIQRTAPDTDPAVTPSPYSSSTLVPTTPTACEIGIGCDSTGSHTFMYNTSDASFSNFDDGNTAASDHCDNAVDLGDILFYNSSVLPSLCMRRHGNLNHAFEPGSVPFDSSSLCAQHASSTDLSSNSNTSSNSSHTTNISIDGGDYVFNPGGAPFYSDLTSSCAPHSLDDRKFIFSPGGYPSTSSKSLHATCAVHGCDHSTTPSDSKATEVDDNVATSRSSQLTTLPTIPLNCSASSPCPEDRVQGATVMANAARRLSLTQEGQDLNPPGGVRRGSTAASELRHHPHLFSKVLLRDMSDSSS